MIDAVQDGAVFEEGDGHSARAATEFQDMTLGRENPSPIERDVVRVMRGEVHDENAFAFGGAAGHAGLFGQIDGVLGFAHDLMNGTMLGPDMMAEMTKRQTSSRGLGWQLKYDGEVAGQPDWAGGSRCSPNTLGHTGFTGTGLWIDLDQGLAWALLTNRVHPSRHVETGIGALRREVGDIIGAGAADLS